MDHAVQEALKGESRIGLGFNEQKELNQWEERRRCSEEASEGEVQNGPQQAGG